MKTNHPSTVAGASQCELILRELKRKHGQWVPMPRLVNICKGYAVHSRISDLRGRGHIILHENRHKGRVVHSFYRLVSLSSI